MFINCRHCNALVATDPATDLPPERCPRCAGVLRRPVPAPDVAAPGPATADDARRDEATAHVAAAPARAGAGPSPAPHVATGLLHPHIGITAPAPAGTGPDPATSSPGDTPAAPAVVAMPLLHAPAAADQAASPDHVPAADPATPPDATAAVPATTPPTSVAARSSSPGVVAPLIDPPAGPLAPASDPGSAEASAASPSTTEPASAGGAAAPGFATGARPARGARAWRQPAAITGLLVLLCLQIVLADRERLAADARWRPLVDGICSVLGCSIPPWREPQAFALLAREVRPHPTHPRALRASATFRNDARWPQPWPQVVLMLSDLDGRVVGARSFAPKDYLGGAPATPMLSPGQTADIALDIHEPAVETVSYAWELH